MQKLKIRLPETATKCKISNLTSLATAQFILVVKAKRRDEDSFILSRYLRYLQRINCDNRPVQSTSKNIRYLGSVQVFYVPRRSKVHGQAQLNQSKQFKILPTEREQSTVDSIISGDLYLWQEKRTDRMLHFLVVFSVKLRNKNLCSLYLIYSSIFFQVQYSPYPLKSWFYSENRISG